MLLPSHQEMIKALKSDLSSLIAKKARFLTDPISGAWTVF